MLSCKSIHDINFMFRNIRRSQSVSELGVRPTKKLVHFSDVRSFQAVFVWRSSNQAKYNPVKFSVIKTDYVLKTI